MKIYVTGATGFVGKILVNKLEMSGFDIWTIVRKKTSRKNEILLDFNTCSQEDIYSKLKDGGCIIHLAANADFRNDFNESIYSVNCIGTILLVNVAKKLNIHFILASNALISGKNKEFINMESKDEPDIPYNISKYITEEYIIKQIKQYTILRIGGIFGYNGPEHLFLNRAIKKIIDHKQIPDIQNDGLGLRNYIYVDDLCTLIVHVVKTKLLGKHLIAGFEILSLKEIFKQLNQVFLDGKGKFTFNENIQGNNQIIQFEPLGIEMNTYLKAFNNIKKQLPSS
jgi:nucleoside-diphosphate-sugar epimerase